MRSRVRLAVLALLVLLLAASDVVAGTAASRRLRLVDTIGGRISPKSVGVSPGGLVFAQNMMYTHTVTVYNRRRRLVKTIDDAVRPARFGYPGIAGVLRGAPVEVAFSPNNRAAYVSNYSMYGRGFDHQGDDVCSPSSGVDDSFVYRISLRRLAISGMARVGAVPKFLAVTPDGKRLLVSNWCDYDVSVVDLTTMRQVRRIRLGAYPRGIAMSPTRDIAYVAIMGSNDIARIGLRRYRVSMLRGIGSAPRHLVIDPRGKHLYATLNGEGRVVKIALPSGRVERGIETGSQPRSMAISDDGTALYVVNYESSTVSKVRTRDMRVVQTVPTAHHPIGITYDAEVRQLWVACYDGAIMVFRDGPAVT